MRDQLVEAFELARLDDSITEIHLRGDGPSFCAGGDLDEFGARPDPATAHLVRILQSAGRSIEAVATRVTAHVHGACRGSGVELPGVRGTSRREPGRHLRAPRGAARAHPWGRRNREPASPHRAASHRLARPHGPADRRAHRARRGAWWTSVRGLPTAATPEPPPVRRQPANTSPSKRSIVANSATGLRVSLVGRRTGCPRHTIDATAQESGKPEQRTGLDLGTRRGTSS